jgi:DNA (cytosine-5)-methyltransferase 1
MGVPQRRERVFFISIRKDLADKVEPLDLTFNEQPITFGEIEDGFVEEFERVVPCDMLYYDQVTPGKSIATVHPKGNRFNSIKLSPDQVCNTIASGSALYHYEQPRRLTKNELCKASSYPLDYDFKRNKPLYLIGMSVPPVMIAQIATRVYDQWLSKLI